MADHFASRRYSLKNKLGDRIIKLLLNSVIAKYRDLSGSRRSIICLSLRLRQKIDLLATDKSRYFAPTPTYGSVTCPFRKDLPRICVYRGLPLDLALPSSTASGWHRKLLSSRSSSSQFKRSLVRPSY